MNLAPLFWFSNGLPLILQKLFVQLLKVLAEVGINSGHFPGHSFRIGVATTAAARGVEDSPKKI